MEHLEKVEKLRERAKVSYEEAKEALEACDWDLLDAMVYLEKAGKANGPAQESYSTSYEEQTQYVSVVDTIQEQEHEQQQRRKGFWGKMDRLFKQLWEKCRDNRFRVTKKGEELFDVPVWGLVLVLLMAWEFLIIIMIVGLFLGCRYSFYGKDDLDGMNKAMDKASEFAGKVKDEFEKL